LPPGAPLEDPEIQPEHVIKGRQELRPVNSGAGDAQHELLAEVKEMRVSLAVNRDLTSRNR
jgi:hypothetical protein